MSITVKKIEEWKKEKNVNNLIKALKDEDNDIQNAAVDAIAKIGKETVESLIGFLKDEYKNIKVLALKALTEIKDKSGLGCHRGYFSTKGSKVFLRLEPVSLSGVGKKFILLSSTS